MGMIVKYLNSIVSTIRKWHQYDGRASRSEFWQFFPICVFLIFINPNFFNQDPSFLFHIFYAPINLIFQIVLISLTVRRLHDVNMSGWWVLLVFTYIGIIPLLYFLSKNSIISNKTQNNNPYAEDKFSNEYKKFIESDIRPLINEIDTDNLSEISLDPSLNDKLVNYYFSQPKALNALPIDMYNKAKKGDTKAMFDFGNILLEPIETNAIDKKYENLAIYWILLAAENEIPEAMISIGSFYYTGNSSLINKDPKKGRILFDRGIELFPKYSSSKDAWELSINFKKENSILGIHHMDYEYHANITSKIHIGPFGFHYWCLGIPLSIIFFVFSIEQVGYTEIKGTTFFVIICISFLLKFMIALLEVILAPILAYFKVIINDFYDDNFQKILFKFKDSNYRFMKDSWVVVFPRYQYHLLLSSLTVIDMVMFLAIIISL